MGVEFFDRFNAFCNTFKIRYYEQGYYKGDDWEFENIIAPYNRLYIILDGQGVIHLEDKTITLDKGYAYLIPAGLNFSCHTPVYMEKLYCHFLTENDVVSDLFVVHPFIRRLDLRHAINDFKGFHQVLENDDIRNFYRLKLKYDSIIHDFIDLYESYGHADKSLDLTPIIQDLLVLIEQNLSASLRVGWLAKKVNMTSSTLSKYYFKHMNRKIKHDITDRLLQKGKILLLSTEKSIQEIAYILGYGDALYFSKVFKKHEAMTPTEYRHQNQIYYR
ncbi:helix-turn-helix transcriptional regulator [Acidaminobacter sp. JC074]|uniref:helix-turn-helix domain-containing protein n=1 Tax=Acidaminobacter sp. JC074 TaxID=2530199 RepID=UPI001F0CE7D2|nr:AraC family transcriptional regulator [Acidaminobacter sp. JC074]MCH4887685.1 helix-turn-helix transcriptional regulator [Acidaminobacter sp. JC074]